MVKSTAGRGECKRGKEEKVTGRLLTPLHTINRRKTNESTVLHGTMSMKRSTRTFDLIKAGNVASKTTEESCLCDK